MADKFYTHAHCASCEYVGTLPLSTGSGMDIHYCDGHMVAVRDAAGAERWPWPGDKAHLQSKFDQVLAGWDVGAINTMLREQHG